MVNRTKEGDQNTAYLDKIANNRRRQNLINLLKMRKNWGHRAKSNIEPHNNHFKEILLNRGDHMLSLKQSISEDVQSLNKFDGDIKEEEIKEINWSSA